MNRAERRRIEKEREKRETRIRKFPVANGKILLSPEDLEWLKAELKKEAQAEVEEETRDEIYAQAVEDNSEFMNYCFAWALHEKYGFAATRIVRALDATDETFGQLQSQELTFDELKERLKKETKLEIHMRWSDEM